MANFVAFRLISLVTVSSMIMFNPAFAESGEEVDGSWVATATIGRSFASGTQSDDLADRTPASTAINLSLGKDLERLLIGASFGVSWKEESVINDNETLPSAAGYSFGGSASTSIDDISVSAFVNYATEELDSVNEQRSGDIVVGDADYYSIGASLSKAFGENVRLIPTGSIVWSNSTQSYFLSSRFSDQRVRVVDQADSGVVGSLGVTVASDFSDIVTAYASGAIASSTNANAAYSTTRSNRTPFIAPQNGSSENDNQWAEYGAGVIFNLNRVSFSIDGGGTIGLTNDYFQASATTSFSF